MSDEAFGWLVLVFAFPALFMSVWVLWLIWIDKRNASEEKYLEKLAAENNYEIEQAAR